MLEDIKKGNFNLKHVEIKESSAEINANLNKDDKEDLTNYLADMMAKRRKAIKNKHSSDEDAGNWSDD